jgi:hypothetical protein
MLNELPIRDVNEAESEAHVRRMSVCILRNVSYDGTSAMRSCFSNQKMSLSWLDDILSRGRLSMMSRRNSCELLS